jgi:alkylhydroperoxidase family enzyme
MGHVVMTSELAGVPEHAVLSIEADPDPVREAVFAFARKVTLEPASVRRGDVDALRPHFTDAQIVELVLAICRYNTMNRLADAFGVPLEKENVFAPAKGKGRAPGTPKPKAPPPQAK